MRLMCQFYSGKQLQSFFMDVFSDEGSNGVCSYTEPKISQSISLVSKHLFLRY